MITKVRNLSFLVLVLASLGTAKTSASAFSCGCTYYTYSSGYYYFWCDDDPTCDANKVPCGIDVCYGEQSIGSTTCGSGGRTFSKSSA